MLATYLADRAALAAHHDRVSRGTGGGVANPFEELAVGDARCAEEVVVARDEVSRGEHPVAAHQ